MARRLTTEQILLNKKSGVYCLWSTAKQRAMYVGSTTDLLRRKGQHSFSCSAKSRTSTRINEHCQEHGTTDLAFRLLAYCEVDRLLEMEAAYIEGLGTHFSKGGLNTRVNAATNAGIVARNAAWNKGLSMDDDYKRRTSETTRAAMANPEIRAKISAAKKGKVGSRLGAKTGKLAPNVRGIKAINLATGEIIAYPSLKDAGDSLKLKFGTIWAVCNGKFKTHEGYTFVYQD